MTRYRWLPASLAQRFVLAAAGLSAAALLLTAIASWWLINLQQGRAMHELALRERQFRAAAVGSDLDAIATRMSEIADSTILATGLVDSAGRETYLAPFLNGIRQINGIPIQVAFTDFEGKEIASNSGARFSPQQLAWLRGKIDEGRAAADIFPSPQGSELVGMEPLVYARTSSPEGAVLYKVKLSDINVRPPMRLEWKAAAASPAPSAADPDLATPVPGPAVFRHLEFRVRSPDDAASGEERLALPYLHIAGIGLLLFGLVVTAGLRLARLLTLDLRRLGEFSRRLLGSGLSAERAPESGSSEVASLARSINGMLDRLEQQHSALLREREKLTELTGALQAADRKKDDFLAMLGHELRNPLAPISAGAELIRRTPAADPRVMRASEIIARQAGHMNKIVGDLLDVSRVTRGLVTLDKAEVDVAEVVSAGVEQARPLIDSRGQAITVTLPRERACVWADRARLVQIVSNLLTNAAKYTGERGHIDVRVEAAPADVSITVQDDGIGIPKDLMPEIFDLFTQGSRAADRHQGGLGLGLALVKNLVGLHGGAVEAASDGADQGSTFTVRLPRLVTPAPSPAAAPMPAESAPSPDARHVMVVDDNADAAETLAQLLKFDGHAVLVAHDGPSALKLAGRERVDAFILDIGLPGMDGMELARRLRARPETADATLIALTGYGQAADEARSAEAGFDHHLVKPVNLPVLQELLRAPAHEGHPAAP